MAFNKEEIDDAEDQKLLDRLEALDELRDVRSLTIEEDEEYEYIDDELDARNGFDVDEVEEEDDDEEEEG
jgi:hypothetical protein